MKTIFVIGTGSGRTLYASYKIGTLLLESLGIEAAKVHIEDLPVVSPKLFEPALFDTTNEDKAKWKQMLQDLEKHYPDIGDIAFIKESNDWIEYDSNEGTSYYIPQKNYRLKKQKSNGYIPKNNYCRSAQHRRTPKHSPFTGRHSISERRPRKIPIQRLQNNSCT